MTIGGGLMLVLTGALGWVAVQTARGRLTPQVSLTGRVAVGVLWAVTLGVVIRRFIFGLGSVSGMSDRFPWGIWIGLDVMSGVALAAGGYVIAATVHVFRLDRYQPILRPTILTAFLGYNLVATALLLDIGRPYRLWHPLVMWQHHSIMFEVAWCVTLYSTVLMVEFSPVVFERLGLMRAVRAVHMIAIPLVIMGVILSTMHQSSLGSLFLIVPGKLSPLWYTPLLPVLFLMSSTAVGLAMTIVESHFSARIYGDHLDEGILEELGKAMALVLGLYLLVKLADLTARGAWGFMGPQWPQALMLILELVAGGVVPLLLVRGTGIPGAGRERLFGAACLVVAGVVVNRLNVSWFGMLPYTGFVYLPSWMEVAVTLSFVTAGIVAFGLAVRFLPVYPARHRAG
ncbi:MAG: NrfD/PsrC family molybdoenzyme membrane anchor subunit [Candidatus Coatesbacteria bacterium]